MKDKGNDKENDRAKDNTDKDSTYIHTIGPPKIKPAEFTTASRPLTGEDTTKTGQRQKKDKTKVGQ
jgi:hypothetical protein